MWDFICLQEVDKHKMLFDSTKAPDSTVYPSDEIEMKRKCYLGKTEMKKDGVMGCSIYYNAQKFQCLKFNKTTYTTSDGKDMNQIYVHGTYKHIETGQIINVATTHLKAKRGFEDTRAE